MAPTTLPCPVDFTREDLGAAISAALAKVTDASWTGAIFRAAANLAAGQFSYDGHQVILRSSSGGRLYRISTREPMRCGCAGHAHGRACWHITAARLIVRAAERHAFPRTTKSFTDVQAEADELFA